ncbi:MAG: DUF5916 domain-containing protein [Acidobacteriota bacterium]|nr:DUF5916 domain-containing protein [Acidobacteriota bacterium]
MAALLELERVARRDVASGRQRLGARHVFGLLDQSTVNLSVRVNHTITPQLTLQLFAQPFVSTGHDDRFKDLAEGRARDYSGRYRPSTFDGNPDFNVLSFRTTNVVRWEYRPGSVMFLVWQQGRDGFEPDGRFRVGSVGDVFEADSTNVFLVKFSRWFNF